MTNHSLRTKSVRTVGALLFAATAQVIACSNTGSSPPSDDVDDGSAAAAGAAGKGGKAGGSTGGTTTGGTGGSTTAGKGGTGGSTGGSSTGGSSTGGSSTGGSSTGGSTSGGSTGSCPPSKFYGLVECGAPGKHPCISCACNDVSPQTLCAAKYAACRADEGCAKTVECVLNGCAVSTCEQFVGTSLPKLLELQPCLQTTCLSECSTLFGGTGTGGASGSGGTSSGGSGGTSSGGSTSGGSGGAAQVCAPNSFRCTGTKLEKCDAAGAAFALVQDCTGGMVCDATAGKCSAGGCGDGWTITYAITGKFTITDTTLGAGDRADLPIGPGELQIRFDDVAGAPGGKARLLSYKMPMKFNVDTTGLVVATDLVTSAAYVDCGVATGNLANSVISWDTCMYGTGWNVDKNSWKPGPTTATGPGCINNYMSVGNVKCTDNSLFAKCSDGNLKDGDNAQNSTWNQPLNSFELSADLKTLSMVKLGQPSPGGGGDKGVETPNTSPSRTWFKISGTESGRVKAPKPCTCN